MKPELTQVLEAGNTLGEGVLWDAANRCVWWTDIQSARLYRYRWGSREPECRELPERLCAFALTDNANVIVAAFASGFARYDLASDHCEWLARPEASYTGTRFNDGRVDRQGRFWCGTMVEAGEAQDGAGNAVLGSLYCLEDGTATPKLASIRISNSLCWNRAGDTVYFADSPEKTISAFDFDASGATLGNRRVFARTKGDAVPDGSCVDAEDCLWNAEWGGGRITRYRVSGQIDMQLDVAVTQPTCVAFGGPDLDHLLITTARDGLDESRLRREPLAGHLLIYKTGVTGLEEERASR
jgi:sugar lactone lactonase YvrE